MLILVLLLLLIFGGGGTYWGHSRYGSTGGYGFGLGTLILVVLAIYYILGHRL